MPTEVGWQYGGYEVERVSPFTSVAARQLTEVVVGYLEGKNEVAVPEEKKERRGRREGKALRRLLHLSDGGDDGFIDSRTSLAARWIYE